jgi:hypothetical protein
MIADPKRKPHQDDGDSDKRRRQEEALDEALKNIFPASDPVSVEQPITSGRACRSWPLSFKGGDTAQLKRHADCPIFGNLVITGQFTHCVIVISGNHKIACLGSCSDTL